MDPLHVERVGPSEQPVRCDEESWVFRPTLELCWLKLAAQQQETSHESDPAATLFPLPEKPATYPVEYGKRAGELIARGARSLNPRKRK
jgi:hypothetical protein